MSHGSVWTLFLSLNLLGALPAASQDIRPLMERLSEHNQAIEDARKMLPSAPVPARHEVVAKLFCDKDRYYEASSKLFLELAYAGGSLPDAVALSWSKQFSEESDPHRKQAWIAFFTSLGSGVQITDDEKQAQRKIRGVLQDVRLDSCVDGGWFKKKKCQQAVITLGDGDELQFRSKVPLIQDSGKNFFDSFDSLYLKGASGENTVCKNETPQPAN